MLSFGGTHVKYGGVVVALVGFVLTRYTVVESARFMGPFSQFVIAKGLFLLVGLGITLVGVGLAVSTYDATSVSIVAWWTVVGVGSMCLVVVVTSLSVSGASSPRETHLVANVLLGAAVGGLLTGFRSASRHRHRQQLTRQADRLTTLNRLLRHEVLNKVNVIRGYAQLSTDGGREPQIDPLTVIERNAVGIDTAIEQAGVLTRAERHPLVSESVDVAAVVEQAAATVRGRFPEATVHVRIDDGADTRARGDDTLEMIVTELLINGIEHAGRDAPSVEVAVRSNETRITVRVTDEGPGLPSGQRDLLAEGTLPEYDDPTTGFGLTIVRLLAERLRGRISATIDRDGGGTAVEIALLRVDRSQQVGVKPIALARVGGVAVIAGVVMGLFLQSLTGKMVVIGSLYGVETLTVGWVTHLFHSIVFGVMFVALRTHPRAAWMRDGLARETGAGTLFGVGLWVVGAGLVMPLWLRLLGLDASVPNLDTIGFVAHLLWGVVVGVGVPLVTR